MASARASSPPPAPGDRGSLGLSFSGGGYRATAFSLGTMALLQDLGLLSRARVMSSVSGGSLALAAYICAKAGDLYCKTATTPRQESEFRFYEKVWEPLMLELSRESLADAFVRLPLLLQGEKVILHAADATQRFLSTLLGEEACVGNPAITAMLRDRSLAPDYLFFNAANISSLDLFRFGIQRGSPGPDGRLDPVYVLNRYYLLSEGSSVVGNELYRHAANLRLGDCVAASFAFPGGFEPLIFPHDFYRPAQSPAGAEAAEKAREHFSGSLICDRRPYVAFLDGGLYDNLGLASVEDIRRYLLRRVQRQQNCGIGAGPLPPAEREEPLRYVIATDVDNIQPGIGFYDEPSLDRQLAQRAAAGEPPARGQRPWPSGLAPLAQGLAALARLLLVPPLGLVLLGVALGLLLSLVVAPLLWSLPFVWPAPAVAWVPWRLVLVATAGALLLVALVALLRLWRGLRSALASLARAWSQGLRSLGGSRPPQPPAAAPSWRQSLGLSHGFDRRGIDNSLGSLVGRALLGLVRGPDRAAQLATLRTASLERRIGQLLPAFNGYLKRTRSLTYGYLQQTYEQTNTQPNPQTDHSSDDAPQDLSQRCHLIRNMIFELIPGPDVDPAYASNLITLPVQSYRRQEAIEPLAPIMRKLRHADYVRDLLEQHGQRSLSSAGSGQPPGQTRPMALPLQLLASDPDLQRILSELNLAQAAAHWSWLTSRLQMDGPIKTAISPGAAIDPTVDQLVRDVSRLLREAMQGASHQWPGVAEPLLRQRCAVKLSEDATSYSWIPLICEMATNLNTTLWLRGFRWYQPNGLADHRIVSVGGWFVDPPPLPPQTPLLDLGAMPAPAAAITALAGYVNAVFNLLEFFYAALGSSRPAQNRLVQILRQADPPVDQWQDEQLQDLVDLPFRLRQSTFEALKRNRPHSDQPARGLVALLEPWLTIREGFPDSWRETFRGGGG